MRAGTHSVTVVAALYLVAAVVIRWLVPQDSPVYTALLYGVPVLAVIVVFLVWPRGGSTGDIRITPPIGALGESTIDQQLEVGDDAVHEQERRARAISRTDSDLEPLSQHTDGTELGPGAGRRWPCRRLWGHRRLFPVH